MGFFDSLFGWGGEDPVAIRQREEGYRRQAEERQRQAEAAQNQMTIDYLNQIRGDDLAREAALAAKDPTATRSAALATVGGAFTPEWTTSYIPGAITDPYEQEAFAGERAEADEYLNRLFKRGVITETGKAAGAKELERQAPGVRQQLQDLSDVLINSQREKLGAIEGRARERAGSLGVGEAFDITPYTTARETEYGAFQSGLPDLFKSQVPKDLFDTSVLGSIAGGAQGAGNRPFDPNITPESVAGGEEDEDPFTGQKPVQKRTTSVF